jgi:hypothetical protein
MGDGVRFTRHRPRPQRTISLGVRHVAGAAVAGGADDDAGPSGSRQSHPVRDQLEEPRSRRGRMRKVMRLLRLLPRR